MENSNIKPIDELSQRDIARMRQKAQEAAEQAVKWMPGLSGKVSTRIENSIRRAYQQGVLIKPITELSDKELLWVRGIGIKSVAEIRKALSIVHKCPWHRNLK